MVIYNISISGTRKQKGIKHDNMSSAIPHYHKQINLVVIYIYWYSNQECKKIIYFIWNIFNVLYYRYVGLWYIYLYVKATSQLGNL